MENQKKVMLSGIQPSGELHLGQHTKGNYNLQIGFPITQSLYKSLIL